MRQIHIDSVYIKANLNIRYPLFEKSCLLSDSTQKLILKSNCDWQAKNLFSMLYSLTQSMGKKNNRF